MIKYLPRVQAHTTELVSLSAKLALVGLVACTQRALDRDAAFRRIQVHEAEVARSRAALMNRAAGSDDCDGNTRSVRELCDASRGLCELAGRLTDRDAQARCLAASESCESGRELVSARCATDGGR